MLRFDDIAEIKAELMEKHGAYMHFRDTCGARFYFFDEPVSKEVQETAVQAFAARGVKVVFDSDSSLYEDVAPKWGRF